VEFVLIENLLLIIDRLKEKRNRPISKLCDCMQSSGRNTIATCFIFLYLWHTYAKFNRKIMLTLLHDSACQPDTLPYEVVCISGFACTHWKTRILRDNFIKYYHAKNTNCVKKYLLHNESSA